MVRSFRPWPGLIALGLLIGMGTIPSLAVAQPAAKAIPALRLCTATEGGNYHHAGGDIREQAKGTVAVEVQTSDGSLDCLRRLLAGESEAAIVQADAFLTQTSKFDLELAAELYSEDVNLLCNKSLNLSKITGLSRNTVVAVGNNGGGTQVTWAGFGKVDAKRYGEGVVPTKPMGGERALSKAAEGTDIQCVLYVAGRNSNFMKEMAARYADKLALVPTDDSDMKDIKDPRGRQVYTYGTITSGTYPAFQGLVLSGVDVIRVKAVLVVNSAWADRNEKAYEQLLVAVSKAKASILKRVGG